MRRFKGFEEWVSWQLVLVVGENAECRKYWKRCLVYLVYCRLWPRPTMRKLGHDESEKALLSPSQERERTH